MSKYGKIGMFKSRHLFLDFIITGILLVSFVTIPLSMLLYPVEAQPPYLTPKLDWGVNGVKYGMGSTSSSVLIADVRTDIPGEEVIIAGINWVRAVSGTDGSIIWERELDEVWYWTQPQMADLDLDGILEVIVPFGDWPSGGNGLYVLHGNNGSTYWETRGDLGGNSIVGSLVVGDIDGDGYPTIFVASEDLNHEIEGTGRLTALSHDGEVLNQAFIWRPCAGGLSLADGDNDGVYELYMGDRDMYFSDGGWGKGVRSFWAENLTVRWNHPDVLCSSQAPPLADVNGDGILDVIVSDQREGVLVLDSRTGSAIRKERRLDLPTHYQGSVYDIDGDGNLEVLFADGDHGSTPDDCAVFDLVEWEVDGRFDVGLCHYGPQVADVTGDGNMDIIATSFNGIHIIDPQTYTVIDNVTGLGGEDEKLQNAVVQDIDDDGLVEVVVSSESGTVWAFDTPAAKPVQRARSEVQFYSERRLGAAEYVPPPGQEPEPVIASPFPTNKAINVPVSISQLRFTLKDYQDNQMNYNVVTSPNVGSDSGTDVDSGTEIVVDVVGSLDYYTMYTWEVKVTDGTYWTNRTFRFTTEFESVSNQPPTHDDPLIEGGAETTEDTIICRNQTTIDDDGDEVTNIYNWYRNGDSLTTLLLPFDTRNATTAKDYSEYGNDATIRGATWTEDGLMGGAYEFHGDDYIMIPHSNSLGGDGTWSEITIEHWIYLTQNQMGTRTISKIPSYEIAFQEGRNNRIFAGVWTENGDRQTSTYTLSLNTWYHVAMTYKDGEGLILYVNGIARRSRSWSGTIQASAGSLPETREPIYLGWFDFFEGKIDEARIYPKALSPEQIYQRYTETNDGLSNNSTIVPQETLKGDEWMCKVTPNDGLADGTTKSNATGPLINTPPLVSNLRFPQRTRSERLTTEDLVIAYDYYDADNETESGTEIRWYKDGVLQEAYNDRLSVDSTATVGGEVWNCTVKPSDGEDFGTVQNSSSILIIENDPPTHDNPLLVSSGGTDRLDEELISHNNITADSDGDEVTNIYNWYVNGTSMTNLLLPFDTDDAMTVKDYSGYGNDGNISGATWTSDGLIGGAYSFDGDDIITIEDDATLGGYGTWSEISIEFWVKTAVPLHGTRIIGRKVASASTGSYMVGFQTSMGDPANTVFWGVENGTGWQDIWDTTTTVLDVGKWYHILCTYESGPGLTIYINGIQRVNRPLTGNIDYDPDEMLFIGTSGESASNRWLNGTLDEVRIYPIALTPAQTFQRYLETRDGLSNSSTIVPLETTEGDEWKCEITPNDSWQDGTTKMSNTLTVLPVTGNSQPRIDLFTPSDTTPEVNEGASLEFTQMSSDPNNDTLTYSWLLDEVEQATGQNWTYSPGFEDAGVQNVTLVISDGELTDSQQWTVTVLPMYELTIQVVGNGTTVPASGSHPYDAGTEVDLAAYADSGWVFSEWSGDLTGFENPTTILMDENKTVTATFIMEEYILTVNIIGDGTVDLNATGPYYYGDFVELTANADSGWSFSEWSDDLSGSENPETIVMNGDKTVTATFIQPGTNFDFGPTSSPVEPGYLKVTEGTSYSASLGYGWSNTLGLSSRDRSLPDDLRRDLVQSIGDHTFNIDLENGEYQVLVVIGDYSYTHDLIDVYAEGALKIDNLTVARGTFSEVIFTVTITDGQLNLDFHEDGGIDGNWAINAIVIGPPTPPASTHFDFGTGSSPVESGYTAVSESTLYSALAGYGWGNTAGLSSRDRGAPDDLRRDLVQSIGDHTFNIDLENGEYQVLVVIGDYSYTHDLIDVYAEGILTVDDLTVARGTFLEVYFTVTIIDGQLNLDFHEDGGIDGNWVINAITIGPAVPPPTAWFFDFGTPSSPVETDYVRVDQASLYSSYIGYGWSTTSGLSSRDRSLPDDLRRDLVQSMGDHTFLMDLTNEEYNVTLIIGDYSYTHDLIDVSAEGALKIDNLTVAKGSFQEVSFTVMVSDGQLNLLFHEDGGIDGNWVINAMKIELLS